MKQIVELTLLQLEEYVRDDPVRPHIPAQERIKTQRKVFALKEDNQVQAICCLAYGRGIPVKEEDLASFGNEEQDEPYVIMPYTIWSYTKGAGRDLLIGILETVRENYCDIPEQYRPRVITLSPKTETATRFHIRNGARLLSSNAETDNFEYEI